MEEQNNHDRIRCFSKLTRKRQKKKYTISKERNELNKPTTQLKIGVEDPTLDKNITKEKKNPQRLNQLKKVSEYKLLHV